MRRTEGLCLLVLLSLALIVPAGANAQARLGGFGEYDNLTYFESPDPDRINGRNQAILQVELEYLANSLAAVFGSVELRVDQADPARDRVYLDELYVDLYAGDFDIRIGKQIFAWGRADAINPTDNLSAWDYSEVLDTDDEKIGVVSAKVEYYAGDWTLEGVLEPSFTPSVLPDRESRWYASFPDRIPNPAFPETGGPTLETSIIEAEPILPDEGFESWQYAVRLSRLLGGWDLSLSWFDGYDDLPAVDTTMVSDPESGTAEIILQRSYHRRRAIGADFATTFGKVGVRGEAAYFLTENRDGTDPLIDVPYLEYTLGVDYTFRDLLPDKDLFVLVEWAHQVQIPHRDRAYGLFDLNHVFRRSLFGKTELSLGAFARVLIEGAYNLATEDWWIRPGFEWSVIDGLELDARIDLLGGPEDSFFGAFEENRRIQLRLKYSFLVSLGE